MNKRWFNYRPIFLVFIFLMLGSLFAFYVTKHMAVSIIITALTLILVAVVAILKRKVKYFVIPVVTFIVAVSGYNIGIHNFNKKVENVPTIIEARIYSISKPEDGSVKLLADSCVFDGEEINGNITIYLYDTNGLFDNIHLGSVVRFSPSKFTISDLFYYGTPNSRMYADNLKYTVTATMENLSYIKTDNTFAEKIKLKIKANLNGELTNENVEIAYSALFGDKQLLSNDQYSAYRLSGVAHLLAVSGLHVGIIVGILCWILKLCRVKGWSRLIIVGIFLIFYTYICDFSSSIVRASIMSILLLLSGIEKKEYDSLTAISLAGIVIFFINPLTVFDVAFLMSFSCVLGITLLYKPINMAYEKLRMPKVMANSMAISTATMVSLLFIMAYFFENLNLISLIANVILIPIFTIAFTIVFVVSMLSLIIPFLTNILPPLNYVFDLINIVATVLGNLSFANFNTVDMNFIVVPIYFLLLLMISRICMAKHHNKIIITLPLVAILIVFLL